MHVRKKKNSRILCGIKKQVYKLVNAMNINRTKVKVMDLNSGKLKARITKKNVPGSLTTCDENAKRNKKNVYETISNQ